MKYDKYDIQTACDIATGDDGMTGKEVIRVLKVMTEKPSKEEEERRKREVAYFFGGEVNGKV